MNGHCCSANKLFSVFANHPSNPPVPLPTVFASNALAAFPHPQFVRKTAVLFVLGQIYRHDGPVVLCAAPAGVPFRGDPRDDCHCARAWGPCSPFPVCNSDSVDFSARPHVHASSRGAGRPQQGPDPTLLCWTSGRSSRSFLNILLCTAHDDLQASPQQQQQQHRHSLRAADVAVPAGLGQWKQDASDSDQRDLTLILGSSSGSGDTAAAAAPPSPAPVKISDVSSSPGRKLLAAGDVPAGLAEWLRTATAEQKQQLVLLGFDEATLQTATLEQLQQLEQKLGLPHSTAQSNPTLQQVAGLRRLQGADPLPGLTEWAKTAPSNVQDDLTKLGLGAAREDHPAVTLQQVTDPKNAAAATTGDPNSAVPAPTSTTSGTASPTGTVQHKASTVPNAPTPLRRKLAVAAHPLLRGLIAAQH